MITTRRGRARACGSGEGDALVGRCLQALGREATPSVAGLDSQSVANAAEGTKGGYDGAKRVDGIKGHSVVDTNALLLAARVTEASLPERAGGPGALW